MNSVVTALCGIYLVVALVALVKLYWSEIAAWVTRRYELTVYELTRIPEPEWFTRMNLGEVAHER